MSSIRLASTAIVAVSLSLGACSSAKTNGLDSGRGDVADSSGSGQRIHQYYYYEQARIYRDCEVDQWFWLLDGTWQCGPQLPEGVDVEAEVPIAIQLESDTPYAHHALVVGAQ